MGLAVCESNLTRFLDPFTRNYLLKVAQTDLAAFVDSEVTFGSHRPYRAKHLRLCFYDKVLVLFYHNYRNLHQEQYRLYLL